MKIGPTIRGYLFFGAFLFLYPQTSVAQQPFYEGKMLRLVHYTSPGTAFDLLARLSVPYLSKYIPGQPKIIVQSMPGGGGVVAANYIFQMAKPDGLTVGVLSRGMPVLWAAGARGIEYDASAFRWIGSPSTDITACVARGPEDIRDAIGSPKPLILGATGRGAGSFQVPSALNAALGTNIQIIAGYKGAPEMHAAMERGEIDGRCASYFATKVYPFLQGGTGRGNVANHRAAAR